jgi:hypothetical protein
MDKIIFVKLQVDLPINSGLDDLEKEVVEMLLKHYNKTDSKFTLVRDSFELLGRLKQIRARFLKP